ncbi:MAG: hypothetical protein HC850_18045 [Rhodomicrobium sp.]|nr:hypothetical protein [Rhodomicrobium sp.]
MRAFVNAQSFYIVEENIARVIEYLDRLSNLSKLTWLGPFVESRVRISPVSPLEELKFNPNAIIAFRALDEAISRQMSQTQKQFIFKPINPQLAPILPKLVHGDCLIVKDADHFSRCGELILGKLVKELIVRPKHSAGQLR